MINKIFKITIIIFLAQLLTGCTWFFGEKKETPTTYVLNRIPCDVPQKRTRGLILLVATPDARPLLNSTHIFYSKKAYQIAYFSHNEWIETPAQMLQPLIIKTLQNTNYFHMVVTPPYLGTYNYILNTQIMQLIMDYTTCPGIVRISMRAQLVNPVTNKIVASRDICATHPILLQTPYGSVFATNLAVIDLLNQLALFVLTHTK